MHVRSRDDDSDLRLVRERTSSRRAERRFFERIDLVVRVQARLAMRGFPQRMLGALGEDDLVQEVRVRLFELVNEWDPTRGSLDQYVVVFARSRMVEYQRKEVRRIGLGFVGSPNRSHLEPSHDFEAEMIALDLARRLRRCLNVKLASPIAQRMLSFLYDLRLSRDELVTKSVSPSQAEWWRFKIRKTARECLEQFEAESIRPEAPPDAGGPDRSEHVEPRL